MISGIPEGREPIPPVNIRGGQAAKDINEITSPSTRAPAPSEGLGARIRQVNPEQVGEAFGLKGLNPYHIIGMISNT